MSPNPQAIPTASTGETPHALPTRLLLWTIVAGVLVVAGLWSAIVTIGPWGREAFTSGMAGIGLTAIMILVGVLVMTPWKPRLSMDWMTMWLGGTVFRILATPVAAFVLYSAASPWLAMKPFGLSVAVTYLVALFTEAAVLTQHFRRRFPVP